MNENWCALCVSILKNVTPEQAFQYLEEEPRNIKYNSTLTELDILDMIELKKECTYVELGQMYGISANAVFRRIKRYYENKPPRKAKNRFNEFLEESYKGDN